MAEKGQQDLKLTAKAEGFDETAKKVDKVAESQGKLTDRVKEYSSAAKEVSSDAADTASNVERMGGAIGRALTEFVKIAIVVKGLRAARDGAKGFRRAIQAAGSAFGFLVKNGRLMGPLLAVIFASGRSILQTLRDEVKERARILELTKTQASLQDAAEQKQLGEKASLERAAGQRRIGGFADAATASGVQAQAARAKQQFAQLEEGDIGAAFGTFGDVAGLSQKDLTDLAILASQDKLDDVNRNQSRKGLLSDAKGRIRRGREGIDTFRRRESQQGEGLGDVAFRPGVTERGQRVAFGDAGNTAQREELLKLLPAGAEESGLLEQAIEFRRQFASQKEFDDAIVGIASTRGLTALKNRLFGKVEVGIPDAPGFGNQAFGAIGITKEFQTLRTEDADAISQAFRGLDRQGRPGGGAPNVTVNVTNQHNGRYIGVGALGNRKRTRREVIE